MLLLHEPLDRREERGDRDPCEHQHRRVAARDRRRRRSCTRATTATMPPTNANDGQQLLSAPPRGSLRRSRSSRPSPAPAATPSRYGSASGLRNTPWYVAPASGERRADESRQHDPWHPELPEDRLAPSRSGRRPHRGARPRSPNDSQDVAESRGRQARRPRRSRARRARKRHGAHPDDGERPRTGSPGGAMPVLHVVRLRFEPLQRGRHGADELRQPWPPARRHRVVDHRDRPASHRADPIPPGSVRTVDGFSPQHTLSASTITSGLDATTYSADSWG